ncbi:MAG: iron chelate uptake ABC transporter family permease subunit [Bacteroidales bacterium]|nr:iron chelate uptake ABC transporter family permease subunit [Bacteroidales bacterium]
MFSSEGEALHRGIVMQIRLPRVLAGIVSGIALSVSGVVMQSVLRNPLGSPFTLGISNAAAFGAAFAVIIFGAGSMHSSSSDAVLIANPYIVTLFSILLVAHRLLPDTACGQTQGGHP